jgi:hypothetical protein
VTTVNDGDRFTLAGLTVRIDAIEMVDYTPQFGGLPPCPTPGQRIEIEGVDADLCYPDGVLWVPDPDTNAPLYFPVVRNGLSIFDWMEDTITDINVWNGVVYRNLSVINQDEQGDETSRINFFRVWPASLTIFNPWMPYGFGYLFDVLVVSDYSEEL